MNAAGCAISPHVYFSKLIKYLARTCVVKKTQSTVGSPYSRHKADQQKDQAIKPLDTIYIKTLQLSLLLSVL